MKRAASSQAKRRSRSKKDPVEEASGDDEKVGDQMQETVEAVIEDFLESDDDDDPDDDVDDCVLQMQANGAAPREPGIARIAGIIQVLNVVVTAHLSIETAPPFRAMRLQLMDLIRRGSRIGFQFNKHKFAALIVSCINPNCCVLIFEKGKVVCAGCSNLSDAKFAIDTIVRRVRDVMCDERPAYKNLAAHGIRARNIVGCTSFPHEIDIRRLQAENSHAGENPIANGIKIPPPPLSNGAKRRGSIKRSGAIHVHQTGYVLIIGAANRREVVAAFNNVHPIVRHYFRGSAESTFNTDQMSAYYASLKEMYEGSIRSPDSFVVIRDDGTLGTVDEWHRSADVERTLQRFKLLIVDDRESRLQRAQIEDAQTQAIQEGDRALVSTVKSSALVAQQASANESRALINQEHNNELQMIRASAGSTLQTVRQATARQKARDTMQRMRVAKQVAQFGAESVAHTQKPKKIQIVSMEQASQYYNGVTSKRF